MKRALLLLFLGAAVNSFGQNVGIGTTSFTPESDALLELRSTNSGFLMPRMTQVQMNAIAGPTEGLLVYQSNGTKGFRYYNGTTWAELGGGGAADNLGNHTATENIRLNDFWLSNDGGSEGIKITNDGKIGVGNADPAFPFDLSSVGVNAGPITSTDNILARFEQKETSRGAGLKIRGFRALSNVSAFIDLANYDENDDNEYVMSRIGGLTEDNGERGSLVIYTNEGGTAGSGLTEQMRITSAGKVGIGLINPTKELDVNGNMRLAGLAGAGTQMMVVDNGGNVTTQALPGAPLWSQNAADVYRGSGRVGIGTSTPFAKLDLYGNSTTGLSLGGTTAVPNPAEGPEIGFGRGGFGNPGAAIQMIDYDSYSAGLAFLVKRGVANGAGGSFADNFPSDAIQALTIVNTGNIGVGTSNPQAKLHVSGDARITDLAGSGTRMVVADANGTLSTQAIPSGGGGFGSGTTLDLYLTGDISNQNVSGVSVIRLSANGNHDIKGLTGGVAGQVICIANTDSSDKIKFKKEQGTQEFRVELEVKNKEGAMIMYDGSYWYVISQN